MPFIALSSDLLAESGTNITPVSSRKEGEGKRGYKTKPRSRRKKGERGGEECQRRERRAGTEVRSRGALTRSSLRKTKGRGEKVDIVDVKSWRRGTTQWLD